MWKQDEVAGEEEGRERERERERERWVEDRRNPLKGGPTLPDEVAFVGKDVEFKGVITYSGTVRIDGALDDELHTDGGLLVGPEAVLKAKVTAGTVVCHGNITGGHSSDEADRALCSGRCARQPHDSRPVDGGRRRVQWHAGNETTSQGRGVTRGGTLRRNYDQPATDSPCGVNGPIRYSWRGRQQAPGVGHHRFEPSVLTNRSTTSS